MNNWFRQVPFSADHGLEWSERWEYKPKGAAGQTFEVCVRAGKPLDVMALKGINLEEVITYAAFLEHTAHRLYCRGPNIHPIQRCSICNTILESAEIELVVYEVSYLRCRHCGHVGVSSQPATEVMNQVFSDSEKHSSTYIDHAEIETRMTQVVIPKLDWCVDVFRKQNGFMPNTVLDIGAGGGHFLAGASRFGILVDGFEKSKASCTFALEAFGLNLRQDDFLISSCDPVDLITFWGLLEYVAKPRDFIVAARKALLPGGMLVVEVPRVDCLGTLVQAMDGAVVARHMDPTSHVNGFTDASLCTALVEEGFMPVAAWYFGMDAYETCIQMALRAGDAGLFKHFSGFIPVIQQALDRGRQCDDIIVAAVLRN